MTGECTGESTRQGSLEMQGLQQSFLVGAGVVCVARALSRVPISSMIFGLVGVGLIRYGFVATSILGGENEESGQFSGESGLNESGSDESDVEEESGAAERGRAA